MTQKNTEKPHFHINLAIVVFVVMVVYLAAYVITYLGKDKLAVYEVSASDIVDSIEGTGVILREEKLIRSDQSGYINYYVSDGSRVKQNGIVYSVDSTGKVQKYLEELLEKKNSVNKAEKDAVFEKLNGFSEGYSDNNFSLVYETQNDISKNLLSYTDTMLANHREDIGRICGTDTYREVPVEEEGLVAFSSDGKEKLKEKDVSDETFVKRNKMEDLRTGEKRKGGSAVYRLVTDQNWKLMVRIGKESYNHLRELRKEKNTLQVNFYKDNFTTEASFACKKQNGGYYVILSFDNYVQRYINQRYLYVELILSETEGLKIPSGSLVKKDVYKIPEACLSKGGNSSQRNKVNQLYTDGSGEKKIRQIPVDVYDKDEKYVYVYAKKLEKGNILSDLGMKNTFELKDMTQIQGVYFVNRGYADFKPVHILERNEDCCIIASDSGGIQLYDRIILNSETIKEGQVIY